MTIDFDTAFTRLLGHEGGYTNNPADPGGETNWGICKRSYPLLDIKNLTREQAAGIYYKDFWQPLADAHPAIRFQVFDFAAFRRPLENCSRLSKSLTMAIGGQSARRLWPPGMSMTY